MVVHSGTVSVAAHIQVLSKYWTNYILSISTIGASMNPILTLFYNPDERRLRAGWRFIAHLLLLAAGYILSSALLQFVTAGLMEAGISFAPVFFFLGSALVFVLLYRLIARWVDRRPFSDYGFHLDRKWWLDLAFGMALGGVLMGLIFLVERLLGWVEVTGYRSTGGSSAPFLVGMAVALAQFILVSVQEELVSRGYMMRNFAEGMNLRWLGPRAGLLISYAFTSSIFGLLHFANPNASLVSTFYLMVAGLFLGLGFLLTGELAIPLGLHLTWNFFQGNVFGFPVSGGQAGFTLVEIVQRGPEVWTGGAFGPEAGLIGLLAILLGSALIVAWTRINRGSAVPAWNLAVYRPVMPPQNAALKAEARDEPSAQPGPVDPEAGQSPD